MRLLLVGPPGAGKGTQAQVVAERLEVPHISTGELFRSNVAEDTELGRTASAHLDSGRLVPDDVTNAMVEQRLGEPDAEKGFVLDGYPRNTAQAHVLDDVLNRYGWQLDAVVELVADRAAISQRILDRARRQGRSDDTEEVIAARFEVYERQTAPVTALYAERGLVRPVDGMGSVDSVTARVLAALRQD